jgi:glutathione synthase/RimK-type ligase-like ATP-grasp enzyme
MFFSNLSSIFYGNIEATRQLMNEISGSHSYGGRVVSILDLLFHGRPNLILLETAPDARLMHYLTDTLGLSLPENTILTARDYANLASRLDKNPSGHSDRLAQKLKDHPAEWVDGFVTDSHLVEIASGLGKRTISTLESSKNGNNKYLLYLHLVDRQLPVFDTHIASDTAELGAALTKLRATGYRAAVVKAQIGASGYGMLKLPTEEAGVIKVPEFLYYEGPCMVQGWIEDGVLEMKKIASPSVQLFVADETVFLFDMTEQILSAESVHQGNMSPPPIIKEHPEVEQELWRQASAAATWLHGQGYRGTASVDFLVVERGRRLETIVCEINARVTGATYPAVLGQAT